MTDSISEKARSGIDALLNEIVIGNQLDADTIYELRAHMEEKYLAYMTGAEAITEDDAMLLVREHFGKPEVIRSMYQETRHKVSLPLFARWFGAAVIAYAGVWAIAVLLWQLGQYLFITTWPSFGISNSMNRSDVVYLMMIPRIIAFIGMTGLLLVVLRSWSRGEEQGKQMWYLRLNFWQYTILLSGFLYVTSILMSWWPTDGMFFFRFVSNFPSNGGFRIDRIFPNSLFEQLIPLCQYIILLRWFDRRPRYIMLPAGAAAILYIDFHIGPGMSFADLFGPGHAIFMLQTYVRMLVVFGGYLSAITYLAFRHRIIAALKPAKAFHD